MQTDEGDDGAVVDEEEGDDGAVADGEKFHGTVADDGFVKVSKQSDFCESFKCIRKVGYTYLDNTIRVSHQSQTYPFTPIRIERVSTRILSVSVSSACQIRDTVAFSRVHAS